jgi:hypothetical protein
MDRIMRKKFRRLTTTPSTEMKQRAFYDSIRDIVAPEMGFKPVVRIFEEDILWERESALSLKAETILQAIDALTKQR